MLIDNELQLRPVQEQDLLRLWELIYQEEAPEWKRWDAPYFPLEKKSYQDFFLSKYDWIDSPSCYVIEIDGIVCGIVTYYWEHEPHWLEMGIVIHEAASWGHGIGTRALALWMRHLFTTLPHIPRVGITTWSGNTRMMRAAEKLGMQLEARIRNVRYVNGQYYDSIRMGLLRDEWQTAHARLNV